MEMDERELRLECLKIAERLMDGSSRTPLDILKAAHLLFCYASNGTIPDGKTPTPATGIAEGQGGAG